MLLTCGDVRAEALAGAGAFAGAAGAVKLAGPAGLAVYIHAQKKLSTSSTSQARTFCADCNTSVKFLAIITFTFDKIHYDRVSNTSLTLSSKFSSQYLDFTLLIISSSVTVMGWGVSVSGVFFALAALLFRSASITLTTMRN